jgi:hypothetical protein
MRVAAAATDIPWGLADLAGTKPTMDWVYEPKSRQFHHRTGVASVMQQRGDRTTSRAYAVASFTGGQPAMASETGHPWTAEGVAASMSWCAETINASGVFKPGVAT